MALPSELPSTNIHDPVWVAMYNKLKEFKERHGSLRRASRKNPLHRWMSDQRFLGNLDDFRTFSPEKKQLLDELQFDWSKNRRQPAKRNKRPPAAKRSNKRQPAKRKKRPPAKRQKSGTAGTSKVQTVPLQGETSTIDPAWLAWYSEAEEFYTRHDGLLKVPCHTRLRKWLYRQRAKAKRGAFPAEQKKLLDRLGFQWTMPAISAAWMSRYKEARAYKARHHGRLQAPTRSPLGTWICKQRSFLKNDNYPPEKKDLLEKLGVEERSSVPTRAHRHSTLEEPEIAITPAWMARYNEAKEFKAQHEHLQFPRKTQLSNWLHWLRRTNVQGTLAAQKKALLDELGIQWILPVLSPKWLASYNEAKTFHTRHGHLQGALAAHTTLAKWLHMQRSQAKASDAYPAEKKELLDSLGFQWTDPIISPDWMIRYTELKAFKTRTGHMHVPSRTPPYDWMRLQRNAEAKGTIVVEKKMLLDGLGFTWRENPTRVNLSSVLDEELGKEDVVEKASAKKATSNVWPSTEERPGDPDMVDTLVLQGSLQENDSEKSRSREQQPTGVEENQKETRDVSDATSADAGEMPAGGELPPGWIMRWRTRQSGKERGLRYKTWKSPSGGVFRSLRSVHKFLEENAEAINDSKNDNF